jgi:hypothetical protein
MSRPFALLLCFALLLPAAPPGRASEAAAEATRRHLYAGTLAAGVTALEQVVAADPADQEARFGLGMLRFTRAVEHLGQGFYRYGLQVPHGIMVPLLRLPVPVNPQPEPMSYEDFRALLQIFTDDLALAEASLSGIDENGVALVVDLLQVRLDMTANGKPGEDETLARILGVIGGARGQPAAPAPSLEVKFDAGDAVWLRGYTHVLMALDEFLLAHDFRSTFDAVFHRFFARPQTPLAVALAAPPPPDGLVGGFPDGVLLADAVALIHTVNWPVVEPARMGRARTHLLAMIDLSRRSWTLIDAETGDDREWIPNPRQKNAALGMSVNERQLAAWSQVLDEAEAILKGRTLIPHWRFKRGLDLRKFFDEPQNFDLVMLLTGAGAVPYLADGEITSSERWTEITRAFEGSFFSYAMWFN